MSGRLKMGYVFLDIEVHSPTGDHLSPAKSRVISIAFKHYPDFFIDEETLEEKRETRIMREWERSEEEIVGEFLEFLSYLARDDSNLTLAGFNHVSFDIPFLRERARRLNLCSGRQLRRALDKPYKLDLMQMTPALNRQFLEEMESPKLGFMDQKSLLDLLDVPAKEGDGSEIPELYEEERYGEIERYVRQENGYWEETYCRLTEIFREYRLWEAAQD